MTTAGRVGIGNDRAALDGTRWHRAGMAEYGRRRIDDYADRDMWR